MALPHDFGFACEDVDGAWEAFEVMRFEGTEGLSQLYRYQVDLLVKAADLDPRTLVGKRAGLRIDTQTAPAVKYVHGVITEAEDLSITTEGDVIRVVLEAPLVRSRYRRRSRVFLNKTVKQIVAAVLACDPQQDPRVDGSPPPLDGDVDRYVTADEQYCFRVVDTPRWEADDARPYCVQYNESDFAFLSRLLEAEGLTYHYENGYEHNLLVISDHDGGRVELRGEVGREVAGRSLGEVKGGGRLRPRKVTLSDFDWKNPSLDLVASAGETDGQGLDEQAYPGQFISEEMGSQLASIQNAQNRAAAAYVTAKGTCRVIGAGTVIRLMAERERLSGAYLVTRLECHGETPRHSTKGADALPYRCRVEGVKSSGAGKAGYRPVRSTPAPRIFGSQTAVVTADKLGADGTVHVGDGVGSVRLRFHWDRDRRRLADEPSSCWVRVSQAFAGAGEGAVWHPRVGNEVVVEFLDGDPDRPIVTGRVYNGTNPSPLGADGAPTKSTFKTFSIPGRARYNELTFDDASQAEAIELHAARDFSTVVERNKNEEVRGDALERTAGSRKTAVAIDNTESVEGNEAVTVHKDRQLHVIGNEERHVDKQQEVRVGADRVVHVVGDASHIVDQIDKTHVKRDRHVDVDGVSRHHTKGDAHASVDGNRFDAVKGNVTVTIDGNHIEKIDGSGETKLGGSLTTIASGAHKTEAGGAITLKSNASVDVDAPKHSYKANTEICLEVGQSKLTVHRDRIVFTTEDGTITIQDGRIKHNC